MSMISELLKDLSCFQAELQSLAVFGDKIGVIERAKEIIKMQSEKLQAQNLNGGWIPCSERTPKNEEDDWCLVQIQEDNGYLWIPRTAEYRESKDDWHLDDIGWLRERHDNAFKVVAWQPLPEPWKGE